jgi:hypothetical protein
MRIAMLPRRNAPCPGLWQEGCLVRGLYTRWDVVWRAGCHAFAAIPWLGTLLGCRRGRESMPCRTERGKHTFAAVFAHAKGVISLAGRESMAPGDLCQDQARPLVMYSSSVRIRL